jgi:TonB-linked outer membrane protein, SusC/RagA family
MKKPKILVKVFVLSCFLVAATTQITAQKVTLNFRDVPFEKVLNVIKQQTGLALIFSDQIVDMNRKVSVNVTSVEVQDALKQLLAGTDVGFEIKNKKLFLVEKKKKIENTNVDTNRGKISGVVKDENGVPLIGASVMLKNKKKGTITDSDGRFFLETEGSKNLTISYVGYESREVEIGNKTEINVVLSEDSKKINEVVVVGYGTVKKKDVTSAISTVDVSNISERPLVSAVEAITGKSSGVQVSSPSGSPGGDLSIKIRGIGSPNGSEPLYVVDGVIANDIKAIDPSTIESINILKDASAAGIYGAAGSTNGVVMITTKHGKKGAARTALTMYTGMQQIVKKLSMLNNTQWLALEKEILGVSPQIESYYDLTNTNNNWQDLTYRNAMQTGINVNTSGGSETGNYFFGIGYLNQDGIIRGSNYKRYSTKLSVQQRPIDWLKLSGDLSYNRTDQRTVNDNASANSGGCVVSALVTPEYIPVYMPANSPKPGVYGTSNLYSGENPLADIFDNTNKTIGNNFLGNVFAEVRLPYNIKYKSQLNAVLENSKYDYFLDPYSSLSGLSYNGQGASSYSEVFRWSWDNTVNFTKAIGKHYFDVVLGTSALDEKIATSYMSGQGYATNAVHTLNAASNNYSISTQNFEWSTNSYFGRLNYTYNDRYLFTGTFRRDGSSRVGQNVVWGNFPALSLGWKASNEDFLKNVKWMQDLKLRFGWGKTGNLPPYTMLYPSYSLLNAGAPYAYSGTTIGAGINPGSQIGNPNLKWESAVQTNVGFDISFLNHNLTFTFDYYYKKVKDMIFTEQLPLTTGAAVTATNLPGFDINKGVELAIDANIIRSKNFNWKSNFNISFNSNMITGIDPSIAFQTGYVSVGGNKNPIPTQIIKNGYPLGTFWGYKCSGVDPQTGDLICDSKESNLGSALPKYTLGFSNDFKYKAFTLSFLIDAVEGNKVYNETRMETESLTGYANESTEVLKRWEKAGDITSVPKVSAANASILQTEVTSHFIEDGSFIRLKNITLSYQFDSNILKKMGLSNAKIYLTAQNLLTISGYKGYYPEVNGFGQGTNNQATNAGAGASLMSLGIDRGTYPTARTYTAGINVEF